MSTETGWHLDKRVPIALICAISIQTAGALVWAGAAAERLASLEKNVGRSAPIAERTARLEEQTRHLQVTLDRIETKIDDALFQRP